LECAANVRLQLGALLNCAFTNKDEISWSLKYYVHHITTSSSALKFTSKKSFKKFTKFITKVIPVKRFYLRYTPGINDFVKEITKNFPKENILIADSSMKNTRLFPDGRFELFLRHPAEAKILSSRTDIGENYSKYSSNGLTFVMHMLAIMLLTQSDIKSYKGDDEDRLY